MMKLLIPLVCLSLLISGCSKRPEVLSECEREHGSHNIERWQCIVALDAEKTREERKNLREKNARECIAQEIPAMEKKVKIIRDSIKEKSTFVEAENILKKETGASEKVFSDENIKIPVLVSSIHTKCDSEFHILINVNGYEPEMGDGYEINADKFYSMNPPVGYVMPYFNNRFHEERMFKYRFESESAEREKRQVEAKKESAKKKEFLDPCAPGIPSSVRLERLKQFGKVRQTGPNDYEAGGHSLSLFSDDTLIYCR